jgi:magnesium transporter
MLRLYIINNESLETISPDDVKQNLAKLVWVDLFCPTREEEVFVENLTGIEVPTREEMREIELSSRLYQEKGSIYSTAIIVSNSDSSEPESNDITFILTKHGLITVRYSDPTPFRLFFERFSVTNNNANTVLIGLLEAIVDRVADILENTGYAIDSNTKKIFRPQLKDEATRKKEKPEFEEMLRQIGIIGDLISKMGESMISIKRLISFISQTPYFREDSDEIKRMYILVSDINSLNDHSIFLASRVGFLLDATLGMINIEQNAIIKIVSVAAVVFLPPTLVASIYGMNFHIMPELNWQIGYPLALIIMVLSAVLPYKFFRHKGWL